MAFFDMPLDQLQAYQPKRDEPADFDAFWQRTLKETRAHKLNAQFAPTDFGFRNIEVFDVTFNGYGGQPIKGWLLMPAQQRQQRRKKLPCVVEYVGYGGGRGFPTTHLLWSAAGYAHLVMDTRGKKVTKLLLNNQTIHRNHARAFGLDDQRIDLCFRDAIDVRQL